MKVKSILLSSVLAITLGYGFDYANLGLYDDLSSMVSASADVNDSIVELKTLVDGSIADANYSNNVLTFTQNDGTAIILPIADNVVSNAVFDDTTGILSLTDTLSNTLEVDLTSLLNTVTVKALSSDLASKTMTVSYTDGNNTVLDTTPFLKDEYLSIASLDVPNKKLVFKISDGTIIDVDVSELMKVVVKDVTIGGGNLTVTYTDGNVTVIPTKITVEDISLADGNILNVTKTDGTSNSLSIATLKTQTVDEVNKTIVSTLGNGSTVTVDATALLENTRLDSLAFDKSTKTLTAKDTDGVEKNVTIDIPVVNGVDVDAVTKKINIVLDDNTVVSGDISAIVDKIYEEKVTNIAYDSITNTITVSFANSPDTNLTINDDYINKGEFDPSTGNITLTSKDGKTVNIDMTALSSGAVVDFVGDEATKIITLTMGDGTVKEVNTSLFFENKVDKVAGKELSTNDLTDDLLDRLESDRLVSGSIAGSTITLTSKDGVNTDLIIPDTNINLDSGVLDNPNQKIVLTLTDGTVKDVPLTDLYAELKNYVDVKAISLDSATNILTIDMNDGTSSTIQLADIHATSISLDEVTGILTITDSDSNDISINILNPLRVHEANNANPHNVTPSQLGLQNAIIEATTPDLVTLNTLTVAGVNNTLKIDTDGTILGGVRSFSTLDEAITFIETEVSGKKIVGADLTIQLPAGSLLASQTLNINNIGLDGRYQLIIRGVANDTKWSLNGVGELVNTISSKVTFQNIIFDMQNQLQRAGIFNYSSRIRYGVGTIVQNSNHTSLLYAQNSSYLDIVGITAENVNNVGYCHSYSTINASYSKTKTRIDADTGWVFQSNVGCRTELNNAEVDGSGRAYGVSTSSYGSRTYANTITSYGIRGTHFGGNHQGVNIIGVDSNMSDGDYCINSKSSSAYMSNSTCSNTNRFLLVNGNGFAQTYNNTIKGIETIAYLVYDGSNGVFIDDDITFVDKTTTTALTYGYHLDKGSVYSRNVTLNGAKELGRGYYPISLLQLSVPVLNDVSNLDTGTTNNYILARGATIEDGGLTIDCNVANGTFDINGRHY